MGMRIFCITAFGLAMGWGLDGYAAPAAENWARHRAALMAQPGLARYYTFESAANGATSIPATMGDVPLTWQLIGKAGAQPETLRLVEGRWPGKMAVRLDQGVLNTSAYQPINRAFTVAGWFRKNGPGVHHGNNESSSGTLLSVGDGYWSGWRLTTHYPRQNVSFEIGRPKPASAIGIGGGTMADGAWQHLAATWDGREMRVYLNGLAVAAGVYPGAYTPAQGAQLRIGYNNAGIGSVILDVDEVAVFSRALSPAEVLRQAYDFASLPEPVAVRFEAVRKLVAAKDYAAAEKEYTALAVLPGLPAALTGQARLGRAGMLRLQKRHSQAADELVALADTAPASIAAAANAELFQVFTEASGAAFSPRAVEKVLALPGLSEKQKVSARLQHAAALRQSGNLAAARAQYEQLAAQPGLSPRERLDARLALGHVHFEAKNFLAARIAYAPITNDPEAPAHYRSLAQLRIAASHAREKNFGPARNEYQQLESLKDAPAHLVQEARECIAELTAIQQGRPAREPGSSHTRLPALPAPGVTLYVAPTGNDANPGTAARPFATLQRARDEVRKLKAQGQPPAGGFAVQVRGGEYKLAQVFKLEAQDSGTPAAPVVYQAAKGEMPRFNGGTRLTGFQLVRDAAILNRLPAAGRGKVWQVSLPSLGITNYGTVAGTGRRADLYYNGQWQRLARWPNDGFVKVGDLLGNPAKAQNSHNIAGNKEGRFTYEGNQPDRWKDEPEAWLYGYWFWDWADEYQKVAAIDTAAKAITLAPPFTGYGYRKGQRYYALNLLAELDQPGEWYLDRTSGMLFLYPASDPNRATIEFSLLDGPMVQMDNVANVTMTGLTFESGRGDGAVINGGSSVLLAGCTFRRLGHNGVAITGGQKHGLFGCDIHTLGHGGTRIIGGNRQTLAPGGHFVENCHIYDLSRFIHTYTPAVFCDGVGNRIAHNLFHDSTSSAMRIEGNDHVIEYNEIYRVVTESDDQGGADLWGNPSYRGLVFRYNYWHHIGSDEGLGQAGIRLDDAISGVLIYGNVFYKCSRKQFGGVQIHGGKENIVDNNLFIDCLGAVSLSAWREKRWKEFLARPDMVKKLTQDVNIALPPYSTRYPMLARLEENADHNSVWRNLVVNCQQLLMRDPGVIDLMDNYLTSQDPGFANAARGDFTLKPDAAIFDCFGMRPIPFGEMGLYAHPLRASWPVAGER